jgi:ATP-dependent exoDNAse (exonuclease V) alpha subunit
MFKNITELQEWITDNKEHPRYLEITDEYAIAYAHHVKIHNHSMIDLVMIAVSSNDRLRNEYFNHVSHCLATDTLHSIENQQKLRDVMASPTLDNFGFMQKTLVKEFMPWKIGRAS